MIQGSAEWYAARLGKVTASRVCDVMARTKTGWGASRKNYMADLIAERLTGMPVEQYTNQAMQWGIDTEAQARRAYEFHRDSAVEQVGFIDHPTIAMTGASPDGQIGTDGLLELKCPNTATHIDTLLSATVPEKYLLQMQWQMACTGRQWCDFASFDPRMPERMRLLVVRVPRSAPKILEIESAVIAFLTELDATLAALVKAA